MSASRRAELLAVLAANRRALNALDAEVAAIEARQVEREREERARQARAEDTQIKARVERLRRVLGATHETGRTRARRSAAEEMRAWGLRDEDE